MHKSKNIVHINTKAKRSQTSCFQEVWQFYSLTSVKDGIITHFQKKSRPFPRKNSLHAFRPFETSFFKRILRCLERIGKFIHIIPRIVFMQRIFQHMKLLRRHKSLSKQKCFPSAVIRTHIQYHNSMSGTSSLYKDISCLNLGFLYLL